MFCIYLFDCSGRRCEINLTVIVIVNRKLICNFLLVINSNLVFGLSCTVFDIMTSYRKYLVFTPPLTGNPSTFLDETSPAEQRWMGY